MSKVIRYCCYLKCFIQPSSHVDGLACSKCESFGFCRCRCQTYETNFIKKNIPVLQKIEVYKTENYLTCCTKMCHKFHLNVIIQGCSKCSPNLFCKCFLNKCQQYNKYGLIHKNNI